MKNIFKLLIIVIIYAIILTLFLYVLFYSKDCIKPICALYEEINEKQNEKTESSSYKTLNITQNKQEKMGGEQIKVETEQPIIVEKPQKGERFGTLKIPSIDVELAMLNGTTKNILSQGVGIDGKSYFPGEGGSIVLMGHNFKQFLAKLPETKNGDEVILKTNYGEFHYKIYDAKVVKETNVNAVPIQKDEEILMVYTCWPIPNVSHANDRYVIYAK